MVKPKTNLFRLFPSVLFAICCISAFTAAGGFSSQISTSRGDVVLLKGDQCGIPTNLSNLTVDDETLWFTTSSQRARDAVNYAQQCYSATSSGILDCDKFVVRNFRSKSTQTNSSCPFPGPEAICRNNDTALLLDSGYLDSNDDFGINTPVHQRLQWRYVLQCAPLVTEGFTSQVNDTQNMTWMRYNYGAWAGNTMEDPTFTVPSLNAQYSFLNRTYESGQLTDIANEGLNYRLR
jgi:hypothetical protein